MMVDTRINTTETEAEKASERKYSKTYWNLNNAMFVENNGREILIGRLLEVSSKLGADGFFQTAVKTLDIDAAKLMSGRSWGRLTVETYSAVNSKDAHEVATILDFGSFRVSRVAFSGGHGKYTSALIVLSDKPE